MKYKFDFKRFETLVIEGAREAFAAAKQDHPEKKMYAFGLYSDDDAMTLVAIANSEEALAEKMSKRPPEEFIEYPTQADYYRLCLNEWNHDAKSAKIEEASAMLLERFDQVKGGSIWKWWRFRNKVFETCIRSLETLIAEGFFGTEADRQSMFIHFALPDTMDTKFLIQAARRLNPSELADRYRRMV